MPEQQDHAVSRPGAGDVTNGSVDYYPMEWEVVRREDGTVENICAGEVSVRGVYGYV